MPNGDDDDMAATMGGTDEGGGMYATPDPIPVAEDEDDGNRLNKRRTQRRHGRPQFRSTRQARKTGGRK